MTAEIYKFADQFTTFPGGRSKTDGPRSGEQFFGEVLEPLYKKGNPVVLDLTGVIGFPTSFLDGSFAEFAMRHGVEAFYAVFELKIDDDPSLELEIEHCLQRGEAARNR